MSNEYVWVYERRSGNDLKRCLKVDNDARMELIRNSLVKWHLVHSVAHDPPDLSELKQLATRTVIGG